MPRSQFIEYVACVVVPDLESVLGIFGADSDLGAYRKVAALRMLFYLYEGSKTIRAMD